jgi:nucleoside-triphosphatase
VTARPHKILLEGRPGVGKTTVACRLVALLRAVGIPVGGFTTRELREHGRRVGFVVEEIGGPEAVIAHVDWTSGPAVGRYHVDVPAFERVALPALERARELGGVIVLDELGRMELASEAFVHAVHDLFAQEGVALVATVHVFPHPVTGQLKRRSDVRRCVVTHEERDELPHRLTAWLVPDVASQ